jgi:hypothetical protein
MMGKLLNVIAGAAVTVGVIWFFWTGAVWQFIPIALAVWVTRIAVQATRDDLVETKPKGAKAK